MICSSTAELNELNNDDHDSDDKIVRSCEENSSSPCSEDQGYYDNQSFEKCSREDESNACKSPSSSSAASPVMCSSEFCKPNKISPALSKNSSGVFCRICHEGDTEEEELISPCSCSGSMGLIHRSCIEKWLSTVNQDTCEICKEKFLVSKHSRPFLNWLLTPAVGDDQRNLLGDTVCFILLTPLTTISAYLCASGAMFYLKVKKSEAVGLMCLASLLVAIYVVWFLLTIRYHFQVWFKWRLNNQDIRLLDVSANRPQSHSNGRQSSGERTKQKVCVSMVNETQSSSKSEKTFSLMEEDEPTSTLPNFDSIEEVDGIEDILKHYSDDGVSDNNPSSPTKPKSVSTSNIPDPTQSRGTPLSPVIISSNSMENDPSILVSSTPESDIYAQPQIPAQVEEVNKNYPCPYLTDLKEHFITIGRRAECSAKKSRGTFSPHPKTRTRIRSLRSTPNYQKI